jgi:hypothetical protein
MVDIDSGNVPTRLYADKVMLMIEHVDEDKDSHAMPCQICGVHGLFLTTIPVVVIEVVKFHGIPYIV